jgi:hypothetical protein
VVSSVTVTIAKLRVPTVGKDASTPSSTTRVVMQMPSSA